MIEPEVNLRKEFFVISLDEITKWVTDEKINLQLTKIAEAREFRATQAIRQKGSEAVMTVIEQDLPQSIDSLFSNNK